MRPGPIRYPLGYMVQTKGGLPAQRHLPPPSPTTTRPMSTKTIAQEMQEASQGYALSRTPTLTPQERWELFNIAAWLDCSPDNISTALLYKLVGDVTPPQPLP